jgi:hypothetical protein
MTDIMTSDVMLFIKWVSAMPVEVYHLARPLLHGVCRLHEVDEASEYVKANPGTRYEFTRILAGHNDGSLEGLRDEATRELVTDFYAAHDSTSLIEVLTEIRDLARTGSKPDVYPTEEDWLRHKCNRIAADADYAIREANP